MNVSSEIVLDQPEPDEEAGNSSESKPFLAAQSYSYGSTIGLSSLYPANDAPLLASDDSATTIRFQVVVWYIGPIDAVLGKVDMRFRVTLFWNAPQATTEDGQSGYGLHNLTKKVWAMHGRQRAYERELQDVLSGTRLLYVPPVSIVNAVDFEVLGEAEVCLVNEQSRLMRWSCLYKASLIQEDLHVGNFPHDTHELVLRLGILKHRQAGKRWDSNVWKLGLARADDTQGSIQIPHGLLVDHVRVPGFSFDKGLLFDCVPIPYGDSSDHCLRVRLRVHRDSSYYDRNIIPLLTALNIVGISTLALRPDRFGSRGQIIVATAFAEVGLRMTLDSRLPIVGYQIKMQVVLNSFFFGLLFLAIGSSVNYLIFLSQGSGSITRGIDLSLAVVEVIHILINLGIYYEWIKAFDLINDNAQVSDP